MKLTGELAEKAEKKINQELDSKNSDLSPLSHFQNLH